MRVAEHSVVFLVVACEMLYRYALAVNRLYTQCISRSTKTCNERIFGIVFEVSSAQRISVNIHAGSKPEMNAVFFHLFANQTAKLFDKLQVPAACKRRCNRDHGAVLIVINCISRCVFRELISDKAEHLAAS